MNAKEFDEVQREIKKAQKKTLDTLELIIPDMTLFAIARKRIFEIFGERGMSGAVKSISKNECPSDKD